MLGVGWHMVLCLLQSGKSVFDRKANGGLPPRWCLGPDRGWPLGVLSTPLCVSESIDYFGGDHRDDPGVSVRWCGIVMFIES